MPVQTYKFGTGSLFGLSNASGVQTPVAFGALQDVSVDFAYTVKGLRGQQLYPLANAQGEGKCSGKAAWAQVNAAIYGSLFFNVAPTTGSGVSVAVSEPGTVPAVSTYIITVAHSATWTTDLGVSYLAGGNPFTKVASAPAVGQYSVAAGVYTFAAADANAKVVISYAYTNTTGTTLNVTNQLQGAAPTFQLWFATTYNGQQAMFKLPACTASKLAIASKMGDWNIDNFEFEAQDDGSGNIAQLSMLT